VLQGFISIVSLSPLLSNLHRRILRSAIIACALQKKNKKPRNSLCYLVRRLVPVPDNQI